MKEFSSFGGFAAHLIALAGMEKVLEHEVLEEEAAIGRPLSGMCVARTLDEAER